MGSRGVWAVAALLATLVAPTLPASLPSMRAASPAQDFSLSTSMEENFGGELLPFASKEPRAAPSESAGQCANLGRMSVPKMNMFERREATPEEENRGLEHHNIFREKSAKRFEKIATRGARMNVTDLQLPEPGTRWAKGIEEVPEEPPKSPLTILNRKLRLEARKFRPADETYPDKDGERQRKRIARKAMTELYNLISRKQWADEQKQIEAKKQEALMGAPGLKSLGWKGDKQFKAPAPEQDEQEKTQKPRRKRTPDEEVIRRWNEALRDDSVVRKLEKSSEKPSKLWKWFNSATTKWARRAERRRAQGLDAEAASASAESREGSDEEEGVGDAAEHDEGPEDRMQGDSEEGSGARESPSRGGSAEGDASQGDGTDGDGDEHDDDGEGGGDSEEGESEGSMQSGD